MPQSAKTSWSKKDGGMNPQNYNFNQYLSWQILMLSNATNQAKSTVELDYVCPRGFSGPPAVTLTK